MKSIKEERLNYSRFYEAVKRDKTRINCDCGGFYQQKYKKVQRILTKLKEDGSIEKINGKTKDSMWILKRE